jgi:hypothetical protein
VLAEAIGFTRSRVLLQLRRPLDAPLPEAVLPAGVSVRTFRVGQDEQAWTALNNRAFASHPDQGGWGPQEVELRKAEPWFDPAGFFLAERDGALWASTGPRCTAAAAPARTVTTTRRSARCTSSASTRRSRAAGSVLPSPCSACTRCVTADCAR